MGVVFPHGCGCAALEFVHVLGVLRHERGAVGDEGGGDGAEGGGADDHVFGGVGEAGEGHEGSQALVGEVAVAVAVVGVDALDHVLEHPAFALQGAVHLGGVVGRDAVGERAELLVCEEVGPAVDDLGGGVEREVVDRDLDESGDDDRAVAGVTGDAEHGLDVACGPGGVAGVCCGVGVEGEQLGECAHVAQLGQQDADHHRVVAGGSVLLVGVGLAGVVGVDDAGVEFVL
ncbi:MAG: hypothetical protein HND58_07720 [Planctomycetota bacterium]|nr:MAG: hypothetical protein HND58_07720 [Planctomycetota bacterium]